MSQKCADVYFDLFEHKDEFYQTPHMESFFGPGTFRLRFPSEQVVSFISTLLRRIRLDSKQKANHLHGHVHQSLIIDYLVWPIH